MDSSDQHIKNGTLIPLDSPEWGIHKDGRSDLAIPLRRSKAYMSDIQRADSQPDREYFGAPQAALREAWRIMAATEPETKYSGIFAPVSYYPPWSADSERGKMHSALADALAAFVEE